MNRVDVDEFEQRYAQDEDPWGFASLHYEQRKYAITMASLPRARYRRCFEPGCSIGVLTERLTEVVDEVVALDVSPSAIERARARLAGVRNARLHVGVLPEAWPQGQFDLVVLSEFGYYWDADGLRDLVERARSSLEVLGHLVAVHWLGESEDHLLHGWEVHDVIRAALGRPIVHHADEEFVLDVWLRS